MPVTLAYQELGSGPPLMILHGLFGSGSNWGRIAKALALTHRVFTLDLRNHGNSPHTPTMAYEEMAEDILAFMDQQRLETATLLGHSMGGKTAMIAALNAPSRFERIVVVDIAPVAYQHDYEVLLNTLQAVDFNNISRREEVDQQLQGGIPEEGLRQFLLKSLAREGPHFRWKLNLATIEQAMPLLTGFPLHEPEAPYPGKALFIGGKNSDYLGQSYYPKIYQFFPQTTIVMLKNAGHWVHAEQPQALLQTLERFLIHVP